MVIVIVLPRFPPEREDGKTQTVSTNAVLLII